MHFYSGKGTRLLLLRRKPVAADIKVVPNLPPELLRRVQGDFALATWQAFRRHVLEGEPAAGVAQELGLSLNSVLLAKSRVLKRLRQEMSGFIE